MATNVYDYEERWYFDPKNPHIYYGWAVTTSDASYELKLAHFTRPELREEMIEAVKKLVPNLDATLVAFVMLYERLKEENLFDLFSREENLQLTENFDKLREIAEEFATNR